MGTITTEAWVLYSGALDEGSREGKLAELRRESYSFPDILDNEVLVEPIYGSWEGNMTHALERRPIDICRQRGEDKVVLGNSGVVRVLKPGSSAKTLKEGDICIFAGTKVRDCLGYMLKAFGYDARNTVGLLAKRTKVLADALIPLPENTCYSVRQWAAFPVRYGTAWINWNKAYGCFRVMATEEEIPEPFVWGWGGGVTMAELQLANHFNCQTTMIASKNERLEQIREANIKPIDRRQFSNLSFDGAKYDSDPAFKKRYLQAERCFLDLVKEQTHGQNVSIFIDYIGTPIVRATLKALARPGVITTAGWKWGMEISTVRATECINWHVYVNTHFTRLSELREAMRFGEEKGWMPPPINEVYSWDEVPRLALEHANEEIASYFPLFQVNAL